MNSHRVLVDQLTAERKVPAAWAASFAAVDRAAFVPDRCWVTDRQGTLRPLDRRDSADAWGTAVYSDVPIVTQLDNGLTVWPASGQTVTGWVAQPGVVLELLDLLDVEEGHNVLEVGTSSGYTTALLADHLGDDRVTSVELDDEFAGQAGNALDSLGFGPELIWAEGENGWPERAPYDRIISAASMPAGRFPVAWIDQSCPGGKILVPWKNVWGTAALMRLTTQDGVAEGPVVSDGLFTTVRGECLKDKDASKFTLLAQAASDVSVTETSVSPDDVAFGIDCSFAVGLRMDNIQRTVVHSEVGIYDLLVYDTRTESWASVRVNPDSRASGIFDVRQQGPRRLWTEVEEAHAWWIERGRPVRSRFGLTITARTQAVWLDSPHNLIALS